MVSSLWRRLSSRGSNPSVRSVMPILHSQNQIDLLVCAATLPELQTFSNDLKILELSEEKPFVLHEGRGFLLTGVGIPATFPTLLHYLQLVHPKQILNIGIAGAYPSSELHIGDVVMGTSEVYGDLGFELPEEPHFQSLTDSRFAGTLYATPFPLITPEVWEQGSKLKGRGCTVNSCTGTESTGRLRERLFEVHFESMEGAAVAQIGQRLGIPVCEVRSISNIASRRDMRFENIRIALHALRDYLQACQEN